MRWRKESLRTGIPLALSLASMVGSDRAPDLQALVDAYSILEVEHRATPNQIRAAYRTLAYHYHPDHLPPQASANERQYATRRMGDLNAAYALIRDAPLAHQSPTPAENGWEASQVEFDIILGRARRQRRVQQLGVVVGFAVLALVSAIRFGRMLLRAGLNPSAAVLLVVLVLVVALLLHDSRSDR